jgi:NADH-quinone oxidoreductase subunit A
MDGSTVQAGAEEVQNLWPFLIYSLSVVGLLAATLGLSWVLGSRTPKKAATDIPFESGIVPSGSPESLRLSVEFYLIAMFFVIFDLETIFIFAWAVAFFELGWRVAFFELGWRGYLGAAVFILILIAALVYEWRTGALDWGIKRRTQREDYAFAHERVHVVGDEA